VCDELIWFFHAIIRLDWLEILKALAAVTTAVIAFLALKNWQRQDKAKREAEFLDTLIDAAHAYIAETPKLVWLLTVAKIGMKSHAPIGEIGDQTVKGAINYIETKGEQESKRLGNALDAVQPTVIRLRSLSAKGQMFKFENYAKCQNAVVLLTWQFDRMESFMTIIGSPTLYWDNPEVLRVLKNMIALDPEEIRKSLEDNNVAVLEFAQSVYNRLYG
jgi:hypothetical protein